MCEWMLTVFEDQRSVRVAGSFLHMSLTCLVMPRKRALERQKPRARCRSIRRISERVRDSKSPQFAGYRTCTQREDTRCLC
jgi:hypothetical protein